MKGLFKIVLNSVLLFFPIFALVSSGYSDDVVVLKPILISVNRADISTTHIADQTQVVTSEDLQKLPAHNLAEALQYISGVDIQSGGAFGQSSSVSIRGSSSRQVLVMIDGIPFNTQLSGQTNMSQIPLENVERIEVIKGGASNVWGSSLGGVINVITRSPDHLGGPHGNLSISKGGYDSYKKSFDVYGKSGDFGYSVFGSLWDAEGELSRSHTDETKSYTKLTYDITPETVLTAGFGFNDAELNYGPTTSRLIFYQPYTSRYGTVNVKTDGAEHSVTSAYKFNDQSIRSETFLSTSGARLFSVTSRDLYHGLSFNDVYQWQDNITLTTGADFDWHLLKSDRYLREGHSVNAQAPYANVVWSVGDFDFIPGIRYDRNSHFGSQTSPSFGTVYHVPFWNEGVLRAQISRVFNAPPMLWLYNSDPVFLVAPNPDLEAEKAKVYEVGAEGSLGVKGLKGKVDLYYSDVTNGIATVFSSGTFKSQNFKKFVRQGGEAGVDYVWGKSLKLFASAGFNDVRDDSTGRIVRDAGIARQSFKWGASYTWISGWTASVQGYYNRWSSSARQANDRKPVFDARLFKDFINVFPHSWPGVDLEIFLNIFNITNTTYWSSPTFPLPDRSFETGLTLKF